MDKRVPLSARERPVLEDTETRFRERWCFELSPIDILAHSDLSNADITKRQGITRYGTRDADNPNPFKDDDEATAYVLRRAEEGSEYHKICIEYLTRVKLGKP